MQSKHIKIANIHEKSKSRFFLVSQIDPQDAHQIKHSFTSQINTGMEHTTKVKGPTVRSDLYNISTTFRSSHDHPDPLRIALTATFTENQVRLQKQKSPPNLSVSKQLKPIHLSPSKEHRACNTTFPSSHIGIHSTHAYLAILMHL